MSTSLIVYKLHMHNIVKVVSPYTNYTHHKYWTVPSQYACALEWQKTWWENNLWNQQCIWGCMENNWSN